MAVRKYKLTIMVMFLLVILTGASAVSRMAIATNIHNHTTATLTNTMTTKMHSKSDSIDSNITNPTLVIPPVLIHEYTDGTGSTYIVGEVINNFSFPVQSVKVTAVLYDPQKHVAGTQSTYAYLDLLRQGENSGFGMILANNTKNATSYSLVTSYVRTNISKASFLNTKIDSTAKDNVTDAYHIIGEVANLGKNATNSVKVSGVLFDSNHRVVDVVNTPPKSTIIKPYQTTSFDLVIRSANFKTIKFASINVQSNEYASIKYQNQQLIDLTQQEKQATGTVLSGSRPATSSYTHNNAGGSSSHHHITNNNNNNGGADQQRGEFEVDKNGKHYYDINNCSNKKGSSGLGKLSECQDAQRETKLEKGNDQQHKQSEDNQTKK
jgi:hypothetical protein